MSQSFYGQAPTMNCPGDVIVNNAIGFCGETVVYTIPTCATNCGGETITQTDATGLTSGDVFPLDTTILEYTITSVGGSSTCSFMIIVVDAENPTFSPPCPGNISVNADAGFCGSATSYTRPKGIDNCGIPQTIQTDGTGLTAGSFFPVGVTNQIWITTDTAGNTATCNFTVTVTDVELPTFSSCITPQTFNNDIGTCDAVVSYAMPVGADNCTNSTLLQIDATGFVNGDTFPFGSTFQEFTVTDDAGNPGASSCLIEIIVVDNEVPDVTCAGTQSEFADGNCDAVIGDYTSTLVVADNCDPIPIVTQLPIPGTVISIATAVTLTATDASGNFSDCPFTVNITDTISPTITCPLDQNVSATTACTAILGDYTGLAIMTDNCDSSPIASQIPVAGTTITTSQVVTLTATDASGNTATCSFLITVDDATAPTITCPSDETVFVDGNCEFILPDYTGSLVIVDNCDNNPTILQAPAPGTAVPGGAPSFVSFSVTDISLNVSVCSFLLTFVDTIAPVVTCPADQTDFLDASCEFRALDYSTLVTGVDNCGGSVFFTQTPSVNTLFTGTNSPIVIIYSAEDAQGNTSTCNFNVNISDTIAPIITGCAPDTIISADANCEYVMGDFTGFITAIDNCSTVTGEAQDIAIGTTFAAGGPYPVILSITDDFNNTATCSFNITVVDNTAPVINCPNNSGVAANINCDYLIPSYDTTLNITDECSSFTYSQSIASGTILSGISSTQAISILVTDLAGNSNSCTFTITVVDTLAPTITCPGDQTLDINGLCQYTLPDFSGLVVVSDFCDATPLIFQSLGVGVTMDSINAITMTVQDSSGNIATCTFNVIPNDTIAPTIVCPNNDSTCNDVITFIAPIGSDDCGTSTTSQTDVTGFTSGDSFPVGITTLEYTVTDLVGNITTCSFDLKVFSPVVLFAGTSVLIDEGDSAVIDATLSNGGNILWTPYYNMDNDTILNPTVAPTEPVTYYTIYTTSADGCSATDSVLILVNTIDSLEINNFLSPNGDFSNDTWTVNKPSIISGCPLAIYNRWGKIVWESTSYENNFDGTNKSGEPLPEGTYFYFIKCAQEEYKGSILLMR
jgi:gliding motility-associated-like protein